MNKFYKLLPIFLMVMFAFCHWASAQESAKPSASVEVQRTQLIDALERAQREVKASRKYIDGLNEEISIKEKRIAELNKKDALSESAITGLQSEINILRAAVQSASDALDIRAKEVAEIKKDLDKTRRKLHRARELTKIFIIASGILAAAVVLK